MLCPVKISRPCLWHSSLDLIQIFLTPECLRVPRNDSDTGTVFHVQAG